ncbi:MAG TPA: hypothetical protein VK116_00020, partial [Planctomycetota bacterium]|nr:hypothetical protein [Planctomycetota bacterium]
MLSRTIIIAVAFWVAGSARLSAQQHESGGERMLELFFEEEVARVRSADWLLDLDRASWPERRARYRAELERMLGIDGLVPPDDLREVVTGTID